MSLKKFFIMIGVNLDADGTVMASTVGSMLFSFGLICWIAKDGKLTDPNMKAILFGNLAFHCIDSFLTGKSAITGVMNQMGYMFSAMHFIFALAFSYYIWKAFKSN